MSTPQEPPKSDAPQRPSAMTRFLGGRPLGVIFRLALLSVLVGFILRVLGLDPADIIRSIRELFQTIWDMGFDAIVRLWRYFLLGAVLVVPIWLLVRLVRAPRGR